jgi:DNA (cytosine-5)-methyltransferase 1
MTALIGRVGETVDAIDLFCGYGGSSDGIHSAGAEVRVAANHSELAVRCHGENFPWVDHRRADLSNPDAADYLDPAALPAARFLWASPSCKYHSLANAQRLYQQGPQASLFDDEDFDHVAYANSERSRVTMLCPLRYAERRRPELVVVENVVEAAQWGPQRRPGTKVGDGSTFRWWLGEWTKLGYEHEVLFLNSMFFPPCPQSRDRMYIVLWRRGNRRPDLAHRPPALCCSDACGGRMVEARQSWKRSTSAWPLARWGRYRAQYLYRCPDCRAPVDPVAWPAYTAINWAHLGPKIGERTEAGLGPLAADTLDRIRRGITKYRNCPAIQITNTGELDGRALTLPSVPFITELRGGGSKQAGQRAVTDPLATILAEGFHHGLTTPGRSREADGRDGTSVLAVPWIDQWRSDPAAITEQLATVVTHARHSLATSPLHLEPISDEDLAEVRYRMLDPDPELRRGMGVREDYILLGNKTEMNAGLGNMVTPPAATWITGQCLASLGGAGEESRSRPKVNACGPDAVAVRQRLADMAAPPAGQPASSALTLWPTANVHLHGHFP